jgi:hypothetical protein
MLSITFKIANTYAPISSLEFVLFMNKMFKVFKTYKIVLNNATFPSKHSTRRILKQMLGH